MADANGLAGGDDFFGQRFEEEFGTFGGVNAVVGVGAELGFFHAGGFAAKIGDARGPGFVMFDGGEEGDFGEGKARELFGLEFAE